MWTIWILREGGVDSISFPGLCPLKKRKALGTRLGLIWHKHEFIFNPKQYFPRMCVCMIFFCRTTCSLILAHWNWVNLFFREHDFFFTSEQVYLQDIFFQNHPWKVSRSTPLGWHQFQAVNHLTWLFPHNPMGF